jgi:hypothetical protein
MKRTPRKLIMKRETVRQLARAELVGAVGGDDVVQETKGVTCPWTQALPASAGCAVG